MANYRTWNESALKDVMSGIRSLNAEPSNQPIYYSGPFDEHGTQVRNRLRAEKYALREGATTLESTDRGNQLEASKEIIFISATKLIRPSSVVEFIRLEWKQLSNHYATLARGDVKAFVAGAGRNDVFRAVELPKLILNSRVQTINGVSRQKLYKVATAREDGPDRAYRMVAWAHVRQDMQQALRVGDRELIRDALAQKQLYENQLRLDRGEQLDISYGAEKKRETELDRRADRLANMRQVEIRAEALSEARAHIDRQLHAESLTREQAGRMMKRAEHAAQDPQKAYRIRELAKLKTARDKATQNEPDILGINNYLNMKEQYQSDLRAMRQAAGQRFVVSIPEMRKLNRRHQYRTIAGHARLRRNYRNGRVRNYPQAERALDHHLQDQRRQETEKTEAVGRPVMHRPQLRAASHRL